VICGVLVAYDLSRPSQPPPARADSTQRNDDPAAAADKPEPQSRLTLVRAGAGTFTYATGVGAEAGQSGNLQTYRVAVEDGLGLDAQPFAAEVDAILADPRGWTASATLRLQRVDGTAPAQFTVYLVSPVTSQRLCLLDGLETDQFTSCRLRDGRVIINSERWLTGVPGYGAPLAVYRAYAVNHEVGHQLGYGHELCPAPGAPAPVMQQQTLGLEGCVANGWPYVGTVRYEGPATDT
jgi:hypothetical protein